MIVISAGDPGGIGPEIIIKALEKVSGDFFIIGSRKTFEAEGDRLGLYRWKEYPLLDPVPELTPEIGKPHGEASFLYFLKALEFMDSGEGKALVTAPVSKAAWISEGRQFLGHTDFLEKRYGKAIMGFWSQGMKVVLFTHHLPLRKALNMINQENLKPFITDLLPYIEKFFPGEELISASVNPHAGEGGEMGKEEEEVIRPVLEEFAIEGPLPSDTVFLKAEIEGKWVLSFFHDHGLGPFKLLHFEDGAEVTLGLPWIRTSPCHGTGFDIAGKGEASEGSMLAAIELAVRLSNLP